MYKNEKLFILTGGPGSGKTTTLLAIERLGFAHSPEVARQIIQEQVRDQGDALPWANREHYTSLMLERSIESYRQYELIGYPTFADRGIPDTLAYARLVQLPEQGAIREACDQFRYADRVFIAPPWREIYEIDEQRKQDFQEAEHTYEVLARTYKDCNYDLVELPKATPQERATFILAEISRPH